MGLLWLYDKAVDSIGHADLTRTRRGSQTMLDLVVLLRASRKAGTGTREGGDKLS